MNNPMKRQVWRGLGVPATGELSCFCLWSWGQPRGARMSSSTLQAPLDPTYQDFDGGINYQLHFQPLSLLKCSGGIWRVEMSGF